MTNLRISILPLLASTLAACCTAPVRDINEPSPATFHAWTTTHSYYALLEIVDAHIDPFANHATKVDVQKYLGPPIDNPELYPHAGPKMWVYPSRRRVPYGSYLVITFNDNDSVQTIEWVSE